MTREPSTPLPDRPHRFLLQAIDADLGCSVLEALLRTDDLAALAATLGDEASDDPELEHLYLLDPPQWEVIANRFSVAFDPGDRPVWLSRMHSIRDVPYLVHTGFELLLMLDGRKPFAKFVVEEPAAPFDMEFLECFEPHVRSGTLIKRLAPVEPPLKKPIRARDGRIVTGFHFIFFTLPGEEWRADANLLLERQLRRGAWNEALERLEGELLGYTDEQNDYWQTRRRDRSPSPQPQTPDGG